MRNKPWTKEEEELLEDLYGRVSIPGIAKRLGRSVGAINVRKARLGLGAFLDNGDYITLAQLLRAVKGRESVDGYANISWIKNRGLPVHYKRVGQCSFKVVKLADFWKWAEVNKAFLDFSKMPERILGKEPAWVKAKRRADVQNNSIRKLTPWTKEEDARLTAYIKEGKKTGGEIANLLKRSYGAVIRRCSTLGLDTPQKLDKHAHQWSAEEMYTVIDAVLEATPYPVISHQTGMSEKAIRGMMYRLYKTENQDKIRAIVRKERGMA